MQSGGKLEVGVNRRRNNLRNSFNPSQNSADNQFLNSERSESNQFDPQIRDPPQSPKLPTPRRDKKDRSEQKEPSSNHISDRNQSGVHRKMGVIHQENLDLGKHALQKQRPRQLPRNNPSPVLEQSHVRGSRVASIELKPAEELQEESKIKELNVNMSKLSESLMDLRHNYRELQKQQKAVLEHKGSVALDSPNKKKGKMFGVVHSPEKEKQIQQFLHQKHREKEARRKVLEQIAEKDKKKIESQIKQQEELRDQEVKHRFKEIKELGKFEEKHKQMKLIDEQRKKAAEELIKKYQGKEAFHKRKQTQDEQKEKQRIQKEKELLAQRKQIYKPISQQEIQQHQQWFIEKREQLEKAKKQPRIGELERIEEENQKLADLWKGKAHEITEQERLLAKRKKKQPKEKARKIKQYREYIREKFKPHTYQSKSQEHNQIMSQTKRSVQFVRRYRYYKGVSYGEIIQTRPIAKNQKQIRRQGHQNMQYMRKLPKNRNQSSQQDLQSSEIQLISRSHDYHEGLGSFRVDPKPLIEQHRKRKLQVDLHEDLQRDQLKMIMQQLKANDERLNQKQRVLSYQQNGRDVIQPEQKEITREMVDNIERKLSLLSQL